MHILSTADSSHQKRLLKMHLPLRGYTGGHGFYRLLFGRFTLGRTQSCCLGIRHWFFAPSHFTIRLFGFLIQFKSIIKDLKGPLMRVRQGYPGMFQISNFKIKWMSKC